MSNPDTVTTIVTNGFLLSPHGRISIRKCLEHVDRRCWQSAKNCVRYFEQIG